MVYWIFLAVAILVPVVVFFLNLFAFYNGFWASLGYSLGIGLVSAMVLGIAFMVVAGVGNSSGAEYKYVGEETKSLKSIGTSTGVEGRSYFLGGGYLGTERVLNYMTNDADGFVRLSNAKTYLSAVKEDAGAADARVIIRTVEKRQEWLWPWASSSYPNYEFHVPAGSVTSDFVVDNK